MAITAAVIMGGASLLGGALSNRSASKAQKQQLEAYARQSELLAKITPPDLMQYYEPTRQAVWLGEMTPEQASAQLAEQSAMLGIKIPQELKDAQYNTLRQLQAISDNSGMTPEDKARVENVRQQLGEVIRGSNLANQQNAQQRGIGGSGLEMLNRATTQQAAVQAASKQGTDIAALAQQRALQALKDAGQLGGQIRSQEFGEQAQTAAAQDAINKFNAQMRQQTNLTNVNAINEAKATDLARRYALQGYNIDNQAQDAARKAAIAQQMWGNQFGQASAVAGRQGSVGDALGQQAQQSRSQAGQLFGAGAQAVATGVGRYFANQTPAPQTQSVNSTWSLPTNYDNVFNDVTGNKYRLNAMDTGG